MSELHDLFTRQEDLHEELVPWLDYVALGRDKMQMLKHPLVYAPFYHPAMNAMLNAQFKAKTEEIEKSLDEGNYSRAIFFHERPYRMQKFVEYKSELSDKDYWHLLGSIWSDSENLWQYNKYLHKLLSCERPGKENMMDESENAFLASLPETFRIYRGHQGVNKNGYSWTLSYFRARWFSQRFKQKKELVESALIKKSDVIAVLLGREEFEIVCHPSKTFDAKNLNMRTVKGWKLKIKELAANEYNFSHDRSFHGLWHWEKVHVNAIKLAEVTPDTDKDVVEAFAFLHDCKRENENDDPEHGSRAAKFAEELWYKGELPLTRTQLKLLMDACVGHDCGEVSENPTIGVCWDADRLDLPRVGIIPDPALLSTQAAKETSGVFDGIVYHCLRQPRNRFGKCQLVLFRILRIQKIAG